jgi:hypothetical protein
VKAPALEVVTLVLVTKILCPKSRDWTSTLRAALRRTPTRSLTALPRVMLLPCDEKPLSLVVVALPEARTVRTAEIFLVARDDRATTRRNCHVPAERGCMTTSNRPAGDALPTDALVNRAGACPNRLAPARRTCTVIVRAARGETVTMSVSSPPTRTDEGALLNPDSRVALLAVAACGATALVPGAAEAANRGRSPAPRATTTVATTLRRRRDLPESIIVHPLIGFDATYAACVGGFTET